MKSTKKTVKGWLLIGPTGAVRAVFYSKINAKVMIPSTPKYRTVPAEITYTLPYGNKR